jgi:integrase
MADQDDGDEDEGALVVLEADDDTPVIFRRQQALVERASEYVKASRAENTQRAYRQALRLYVDWCMDLGVEVEPLTPTKVALFATTLAESGKAWSTINVALAGLDYSRKLKGLDPLRSSREVSEVCEGIRRVHGTGQKQAKPLTVEQLRTMLEHLDGNTAVRDKAILLLGFSGAYRRSELTGLDVGDLQREEDGFVVTMRHSKTDQTNQGILKAIPYGGRASTCPVRALDAWLSLRGGIDNLKSDAPLFVPYSPCCPRTSRLTDQAINRLVKSSMADAGLDNKGYSGHSLRAGFVTTAARAGKRLDLIMQQTGHKNVETVMRYIRHVELFKENAAEGLGL